MLSTDDTLMPMQQVGGAKRCRIWVYVGDEDHPYNVFDFTQSRSRDGPMKFLANYRGTIIADAYGGYDGIVVGNGIMRAGCWLPPERSMSGISGNYLESL